MIESSINNYHSKVLLRTCKSKEKVILFYLKNLQKIANQTKELMKKNKN